MHSSITHLGARLKELEDAADQPDTAKHAPQLLGKLTSLDEEFRGLYYYDVIALIEEGNEDVVEAEQIILDKHEDDVAALTVSLESLSIATVASTSDARRSLSRSLALLQTGLRRVYDLVEDTPIERSALI